MVSTETGNLRSSAKRLLLVEDEFLIRLTLGEALLDAGYEVLEAASADEALAVLAKEPDHPISLMLTDIQLPGPVNGHELANRVRKHLPDLPVIFMTGRPDAGMNAASPRHNVFIAKPYLPSDVCTVVERLLSP